MSNSSDVTPRGHGLVLDFIDPLFAVVIHISIVEGVMKARWYEEWRHAEAACPQLTLDDGFNLGVLLLGYVFVVTSWIGYHRSVKKKPIRDDITPGYFRFVFDILLLVIYAFMLAVFERFQVVLALIVISFLLFVAWDVAKSAEYPPLEGSDDENEMIYRRRISYLWCAGSAAIFVGSLLLHGNWTRWALLGLSFLFAILYRLTKGNIPIPFLRPSRGPRPVQAHKHVTLAAGDSADVALSFEIADVSVTSAVPHLASVALRTATAVVSSTVKGHSAGRTTVTAMQNSKSAVAIVEVTLPRVVSLAIEPGAAVVGVGSSMQMRAMIQYSDNTKENVASAASWASSDSAVATIAGGKLAGITAGVVTLTASEAGLTSTATVTVS